MLYQEYLWLIVFCGCGIASCVTYIVCLLAQEKRQRKKYTGNSVGEEVLVINLDD